MCRELRDKLLVSRSPMATHVDYSPALEKSARCCSPASGRLVLAVEVTGAHAVETNAGRLAKIGSGPAPVLIEIAIFVLMVVLVDGHVKS